MLLCKSNNAKAAVVQDINFALKVPNPSAGPTQILQGGMNTFLYGVNREAQVAETQTGYFLPDALGSVRQMTDAYGDITLTQSYTPYGEILYSEGTESYDPQTGLVYLRTRYRSIEAGQFIKTDLFAGINFGTHIF